MGLFRRANRLRSGADPRRFAAVGYPKVGNTWLRVMLGRYLQTTHGLADLPLLDDAAALARAGIAAAGEFTHAPLTWETQTPADLTAERVVAPFRHLKVLLLVRHPLDVLVSLHKQETTRNPTNPYRGTLVELIEDPVFGLDKLLLFYRLWANHRDDVSDFLLWRYEDARTAPAKALGETLAFLGEPVDEARIADAADYASFDNMRSMELSGRQPVYRSSGLAIFATGDASNPDALHVRKGKVGGWRDELPPSAAARFEARVRSEMPDLYGYS